MKPLAKTLAPLGHALATIGLASAAITPVLAADVEQTTIAVRTSDLDLATHDGQKALDRRVDRAIRSVCRTTELRTGSRIMSQEARECLAKARVDTRQQVAALTLERQRGG